MQIRFAKLNNASSLKKLLCVNWQSCEPKSEKIITVCIYHDQSIDNCLAWAIIKNKAQLTKNKSERITDGEIKRNGPRKILRSFLGRLL